MVIRYTISIRDISYLLPVTHAPSLSLLPLSLSLSLLLSLSLPRFSRDPNFPTTYWWCWLCGACLTRCSSTRESPNPLPPPPPPPPPLPASPLLLFLLVLLLLVLLLLGDNSSTTKQGTEGGGARQKERDIHAKGEGGRFTRIYTRNDEDNENDEGAEEGNDDEDEEDDDDDDDDDDNNDDNDDSAAADYVRSQWWWWFLPRVTHFCHERTEKLSLFLSLFLSLSLSLFLSPSSWPRSNTTELYQRPTLLRKKKRLFLRGVIIEINFTSEMSLLHCALSRVCGQS